MGDTLLAAGAEHEAGLLIMGAYSHSRLREMLLGGATRHILNNASARPFSWRIAPRQSAILAQVPADANAMAGLLIRRRRVGGVECD